jgi:SAM-dependent methyltransferase
MPENDPQLPLYEAPATRELFDAGARRIQRQFWDSEALAWDSKQANRGLQPHHLAWMAPWLTGPVLLVGAGRGMMLQALRAEGHAATGVDWSVNMVAEAQREGVIGLSHGDACHLRNDSESLASVIFSTGVLLPTHTRERRNAYLAEAWRVLAPEGKLLLCLWFEQGCAAARRAAENVQLPIHTLRAQVHWDLEPLAASLADCGFRSLAQIKYDDIFLWSLAKTLQTLR